MRGNTYGRSKVNYTGSEKPVTVFCPKHGPFKVIPNKFLKSLDGQNVPIAKKQIVFYSRRERSIVISMITQSYTMREIQKILKN